MGRDNWKDPNWPKDGWTLADVVDLGEPVHECQACGSEKVRYVHILTHPQAAQCEAGCVCAGRMIGDPARAKAIEAGVRNKAARRERWLTRKWKVSTKGNHWMTLDNSNLTVFPNKYREGQWSWSIDGTFSKGGFSTPEAAKLNLFEVWNQQQETGRIDENVSTSPRAILGGQGQTALGAAEENVATAVRFTPSPEQIAIEQSRSPLLRVRAFSGTGKSTSLVGYATARPSQRMLYLAFNKPVQLEAERKFPKNVHCRTTHSISWKFGKPYADANQLGDNRTLDVARELLVAPLRAVQIIETVNNYLCSADPVLDARHISHHPSISLAEHGDIVGGARILWERMKDLRCTSVRMPHDGYLKLFQLSNPVLNYDVILFDEAQDANPATTDIVLRQTCRKVFVGDSHQSIYGFRGAEDALDKLPADETLYLTSSFRFGRGVANVANLLLAEFKYEENRLKGQGKHSVTQFVVDTDKTYAFIARTNAIVFDRAVELIDSTRPMHFVGGPAGYRFDRILDAYWLYSREPHMIKDPYYRRFGTFSEMEKVGEDTDDMELKMLCKVVLKYTDAIPNLLERLNAKHDPAVMAARHDPAVPASAILTSSPALIFTTAHKSKGLEFDQVVLADDFADLLNEKGQQCGPEEINDEDVNLIYVASTRAQRALQINDQMARWLDKLGVSLDDLNDQEFQWDTPGRKAKGQKPALRAA